MKVILGKAKQGKSSELLKQFLKERKSATFLSDELSLTHIIERIEELKANGEDVCDLEGKEIRTNMNVNCNADYYSMIQNLNSQAIFLDIHLPRDFKDQFKVFCLELEREYGLQIWLTEQANADADMDEVRIIDYVK